MMEFNIEIRKRQLKSLKQYIKSSEDSVQAVLQSLGWNSKKTLERENPKVICPIDKNHLICYKTSEKHLEKCTLHSSRYDLNEDYLSEPPGPSDSNIKLNTARKIEILSASKTNRSDFKTAWNGRDPDPMTADRLTSTFSADERTAIYDYCIKRTKAPPIPEEFTLVISESKEKKKLSEKEKLALERDAKRRSTKYRSVHTSKKSQTEIMREVIDNQMTLYKEWIENKRVQEEKEREKLEKIKKEKEDQQNSQYHYIETTYGQSNLNQNNVQWNQSTQYSDNYGNQYCGSIQATQGIITDWSHVYQGGIDTDIYEDSGAYQLEDGEYVEQSKTSINSTNINYTDTTSVDVVPKAYNGYSQYNNFDKEYSSKIKDKEHSGSEIRYAEHSPYDRKRKKSRSREKDRKHEKDTSRHRSRDRRRDKRH